MMDHATRHESHLTQCPAATAGHPAMIVRWCRFNELRCTKGKKTPHKHRGAIAGILEQAEVKEQFVLVRSLDSQRRIPEKLKPLRDLRWKPIYGLIDDRMHFATEPSDSQSKRYGFQSGASRRVSLLPVTPKAAGICGVM
jgi:hypothetical protein